MITVIHGPAASGKSRNRLAIASHYGCTHIREDFCIHRGRAAKGLELNLIPVTPEAEGRAKYQLPVHPEPHRHILVLTYEAPDVIRKALPHARLISIHDALSAIGGGE
ncbi:hypothetical protein SAMN06295912_108144 [Sphingomonas laterariae]|uniref:Uncharacterized protein n=1 Tax=Edaphosphingomonas laterariae TaxID=861865 RepID=A0A239FA78_9SPHN|nr:hypothetical protein [Sphingomonas laterariae]SNS53816.1 hypothetical protein SAMN06295912_108144 [Sphingomonas laterariae]